MNLKKVAASGIKWNAGFSVLSTVLYAVRLIALARLLSPEAFGLMAIVTIVVGFAQAYSDAGVSAAIIHKQDVSRDRLSSLYWLNVFVGVAIFLIVFLLTPIFVWFFGNDELSALVRVTAVTFLIIPWGKQYEILLRRDLRFSEIVWIQSIALTVSTLVSILGAYLGAGVWALVWGQLSQDIILTTLFIWHGSRWFLPRIHFQRADLKGYIDFGLYQMGERSVNFLAERLDQLVMGSVLGTRAMGYYSFAYNLVSLPLSRINPIVNTVAFPVFSKVQEDTNRLQRGYMKVIKLLTIINTPLLLGLAVVSPTVIPLFFGEQWSQSIVIVQLLSLVALSRTIGNPVGSLLLAAGRASLGFYWNLLLLVVTLPCIYAGARLGGAIGMAVALLLIQIILQIPAYYYLIRPIIGQCGLMYAGTILKSLLLATGMAILVWIISLLGVENWPALVTQVLLGGASYLALLWLFERQEILELREVFSNR